MGSSDHFRGAIMGSMRKLTESIEEIMGQQESEGDSAEELTEGKAPSVSEDIKKLVTSLFAAQDALSMIEGKFHYAIKGTLGGTGKPIKDAKARKAIEGSYKYIKRLEDELREYIKGVSVISNNVKGVDAEISAMFGEAVEVIDAEERVAE